MNRNRETLLHEMAFLSELIKMAVRTMDPARIVVFGSRARGDGDQASDLDIAFFFDHETFDWARFVADAEEDLPTLLELNLVNARSASRELLNSVEREGICIYERKTNV